MIVRGECRQTRRNPWRLTEAQYRVVQLVCQGLATDEICEALCITRKTFQTHLRFIFHKTGAFDRVGLVVAVLHHPLAREACFPDLQIRERRVTVHGTSRTDA